MRITIPYLALGTAVLGAELVPPTLPLATLDAAALGLTPDLTPCDPADFNAETFALEFKNLKISVT